MRLGTSSTPSWEQSHTITISGTWILQSPGGGPKHHPLVES